MTYPFIKTVKQAVDLLIAGKYSELEAMTSAKRLKAQDIAKAVSQYGRVLITPPEHAYEELDVVPVCNASCPQWSVRMGLWTLEEGRSDLSLELTVIEGDDGCTLELDDIHVL